MSGGTTTTTNENQSSQTQPWTPAIPLLTGILNQAGTAPVGPTSGQTGAVSQIQGEASGIPGFGTQGVGALTSLYGLNTTPQQAALNTGIGALSPVMSANWMNPNTNPFLGPALATTNQDITNQIEGQFAAAGRPVGTNADGTQALARGLSQGEAGLLTNEFNTLEGQTQAGVSSLPGVTQGLTTQELAPGEAGLQANSAVPQLSSLFTAPGIANLSAAGLGASLPTINLAGLESVINPIAGMGAESTGELSGTTTQQGSLLSNILGGMFGGMGLIGGTGGFGANGWLTSLMSSDERVKEDIHKVGELDDGSNVYSFRYKNDPSRKTQIGLLAQEVERDRPDAVVEIGGVKFVDYHKATERSRAIGMLDDYLEAA